MNKDERRSLAQQIDTNPLYREIIAAMERDAIEAMVYAAKDDLQAAQMNVAAVRAFKAKLNTALAGPTARKGLS